MPRQSRIDTTGALHHIIARGIERRLIFDDDQDRHDFIRNLGFILEQTKTTCYAWSLLPNHFHLLLKTGQAPIATVMRRLLTGHAVRFNRRHQRYGHLFQNRYKSILCQEDSYLLELVRYIHLNPLRAKLVPDLDQLDRYPFSGHAVIMGKSEYPWQSSKDVLDHFGKTVMPARRKYKEFVTQGISAGKRADLTGGGLIRSAGGWAAVKERRESQIHVKSDERILGDGDFVSEILSQSEEFCQRDLALKAIGVDLKFIARRVATLLDLSEDAVWQEGKFRHIVHARSLLCYWAVRELGESMSSLAHRLNISTVAVSKSVIRGAEIAKNEGFELISAKILRASPSPQPSTCKLYKEPSL
ncbi:MAG: transposase [Pseudomonadota bacterium]